MEKWNLIVNVAVPLYVGMADRQGVNQGGMYEAGDLECSDDVDCDCVGRVRPGRNAQN